MLAIAFHPQETCPEAGDLEGKLKDKPGLKLIAELRKDREDCLDIFDDIIESGVPIAYGSIRSKG